MKFIGIKENITFEIVSFVISLGIGCLVGYYSPNEWGIASGVLTSIFMFIALQVYEGVKVSKLIDEDIDAICLKFQISVDLSIKKLNNQVCEVVNKVNEKQTSLNNNFSSILKLCNLELRSGLERHTLNELCDIAEQLIEIYERNGNKYDFFTNHIKSRIGDLHRLTLDAGVSEKLRVTVDHEKSLSEIQDLINNSDKKTWQFTWPISENDPLLTPQEWRDFFYGMLVSEGAKNIEVSIFLVGSIGEKNKEAIDKLKALVDLKPKWVMAQVSRESYQELMKSISEIGHHVDFALFGERLVYVANSYDHGVDAYYFSGERTVSLFSGLFQRLTHNEMDELSIQSEIDEPTFAQLRQAFRDLEEVDKV